MRKVPVSFVLAALCCALLVPQLVMGQEQKDPNDPDTFVPSGNGTPIPDNAYDGTIGSMTCMMRDVSPGMITAIDVDITLEHTWVGDLVFKLVSPSNEVLTMMSRPGLAEGVDDGTGCCGDSSNLIATSPLNFADGNPTDAEMMGSTIDSTMFVCQDDGECTFFPNPDSGPGTNFAQFVGQDGGGTWQVCVGDGAGGDTGNLVDTAVNVTIAVPTTNRLGLLLLVALLAVGSLLVLRRKATIG